MVHHATGRMALDLHPEDVYWCTADPGWVTGTSYGIVAPLCSGATMLVDEADFDADRWYGILADERVNVWYTAPTALRMLMRIGTEPLARPRPRRTALRRQRRRAAEPRGRRLDGRRSTTAPPTTTGGRPRPAAS